MNIEQSIIELVPASYFNEHAHVRSKIASDEINLREKADQIITLAIEQRVINGYMDQAIHNKAWLRNIINKLESDGYLHKVAGEFWHQQINRLPY